MPSAPGYTPADDRRRHTRTAVRRLCKIFDPRTGKYHAASTVDLSNGGVLLRSRLPLHIATGDQVLVGVAMDERRAVVFAKELIECVVVRKLESDDGATALAVQFQDTGVSVTSDLRHAA